MTDEKVRELIAKWRKKADLGERLTKNPENQIEHTVIYAFRACANELEAALAESGAGQTDICGEPAGHLIAGVSWFACVLPKGHEPVSHPDAVNGHLRGGNCLQHGEYKGARCPQWPNCLPPIYQAALAQPVPASHAEPSATGHLFAKATQPLAKAGETSAEWDARAQFVVDALDQIQMRHDEAGNWLRAEKCLERMHKVGLAKFEVGVWRATRSASGGQRQPASMLLSQKCIWSASLQDWVVPNKQTYDNLIALFNRLSAPAATPELSEEQVIDALNATNYEPGDFAPECGSHSSTWVKRFTSALRSKAGQ